MPEHGRRLIRDARPGDAAGCAAILNAWIDAREWMPRVHSPEAVTRFYKEFVFRERKVRVAGDPVRAFLAFDAARGMVTALHVAEPGRGIGKVLLDHAKEGRDRLELWTFVANTVARRFYVREGFSEVRRTPGDNEEGLPDVLLRRSRA